MPPRLPSLLLGGLLQGNATGNCIGGAGKRQHQPVAGRLDLRPVVRGDDGAAGGEVRLPQDLVAVVTQPTGQLRGPDEITEQHRDCFGTRHKRVCDVIAVLPCNT